MKLNYYLVISFLCNSVLARAQEDYDSIVLLVDRTESIADKITIYNEAAIRLKDSNLKSSLDFAQRANKLSMESGNERGTIQSLLTIGRYYTRQGNHDIAMSNYMDALKRSEAIHDDMLLVQSYKIIGNGYYFQGNTLLGLVFDKKALDSKLISNDVEAADLKHNIGLVFIEEDKLDSARLFIEEAIPVYDQLNRSN
jgi:tetratricopeptide (TPR) repeat protein